MLRWIRRLLIFLVASIVLTYFTLKFAVPAVVSTRFVANKIESSLSASLGRPVKLTPDLQISWGLHPHLKLSEVLIGNPSGISDPRPFIALKQVEAKLDSWTLLSDEISFPLLAFKTAVVTLITRESGENNWSFASAAEAAPPPTDSQPAPARRPWLPRIRRIALDSLQVAYDNAQSGEHRKIAIEGFGIDDFGGAGEISLKSHASLDERKFVLSGKALDLRKFLESGRFPLKLQLEHSGQRLELDGAVTGGGKAPLVIDTKVSLIGTELDTLIRSFGVESIPVIAKDNIQGELRYADRKLSFAVKSATLDDVTVSGEGSVTFGPPKTLWKVQAKIEGGQLETLLRGFGIASPPAIDRFRAELAAESAEKGLRIVVADSEFDGAGLQGEIELPVHPTDRVVTGQLAVRNLDLTRVLPPGSDSAVEEKEKPKEKFLFSERPIDLAALRNLQVDVDLALNDVTPSAGLDIAALTAKVAVAHGELALKALDSKVFGGTVKGDVALGEKGLLLHLDADQLAYEKVTSSGGVAGGTMDLSTDLRGTGNSPRAIASSLKGSIDFRLGEVPLSGGGLFLSTSSLFEILNPLSKDSKTVFVDCALAQFKVADGVATSRGLAVKIGDVSILGEGEVDLKAEEMSLGFVPQSTSVGAATLVPPLKVFGSLRAPTILPNPLRLATTQIDNLEGMLTGALGALSDIGGDAEKEKAALSSRKMKAATCEQIVKDNSKKLTSLVGGLVFGNRPELIEQVREKGLMDPPRGDGAEGEAPPPVRKRRVQLVPR